MGLFGHVHGRQDTFHQRFSLFYGHIPNHEQRILHVFKHREHRKQIEILKHETQVPAPESSPPAAVHPADLLSGHGHLASARTVQTSDHVERGGFPASGRTHKCRESSAGNAQGDIPKRGDFHLARTVDLGNIIKGYDVHRAQNPCRFHEIKEKSTKNRSGMKLIFRRFKQYHTSRRKGRQIRRGIYGLLNFAVQPALDLLCGGFFKFLWVDLNSGNAAVSGEF